MSKQKLQEAFEVIVEHLRKDTSKNVWFIEKHYVGNDVYRWNMHNVEKVYAKVDNIKEEK